MTDRQRQTADQAADDKQGEQPPRVIDAAELFHGQREILIELDGVRYRLRITRRNKLILQK
jgi:hemin uptake protein HemP